ncbi:MAG: arylsulfatase A-like enzyme [Planctomycetota bacterium]|jgi:arylsulfatase A-like enzyme
MTARTARLLSAVLASLLCAGCSPQESADTPPNVILICMDTVRADHIGAYGYNANPTTPALDELAARSSVYLDTSATACWTKPSVPSFLTGTYPIQHGAYLGDSKTRLTTETDTLPQAALTLAELYSDSGYQTAAFVRNAQLRAGLGFEQGFDTYHDDAGDAQQIRWHATDWLDAREAEQPFFLYLHYLDAHWPYPVPEEYAELFADPQHVAMFQSKDWRALRKSINSGEHELAPEELQALIDLYDGAIRYIDDQLAVLFAKLAREGLAENTIICVISDHGEEFMEHGRIGHGHGLYEALLQVPFVLHVPGQEAERVSTPCSLVDLFPTLVAASGQRVPNGLPGVNLRRAAGGDRALFAEHLGPHNYQQSWRRLQAKHWREGSAVPGRLEAAAQPEPEGLARLTQDTRWEVGLRLDSEGQLIAKKISPREDEDPNEPLEIKGPVEEQRKGSFVLNGVTVNTDANTTHYGELTDAEGTQRNLRNGMLVKVRGALGKDGHFLAQRIKLYADAAEVERELRGPLGDLDGEQRFALGGIWIQVDGDTKIEAEKRSGKPRLTREHVLEMVELTGGTDETQRFQWESWSYNLLEDSLEQTRLLWPANDSEFGGKLGLPKKWAQERLWRDTDRASMSAEDMANLRAIGYAE